MIQVQFSKPDMSMEEISEVKETILSDWITTGKKTKEFECWIAGYCGVNKAVCLNSQTACAELALRILELDNEDGKYRTGTENITAKKKYY